MLCCAMKKLIDEHEFVTCMRIYEHDIHNDYNRLHSFSHPDFETHVYMPKNTVQYDIEPLCIWASIFFLEQNE